MSYHRSHAPALLGLLVAACAPPAGPSGTPASPLDAAPAPNAGASPGPTATSPGAPLKAKGGLGTLYVDGAAIATDAKVLIQRYTATGVDLALGGTGYTFLLDINLDGAASASGTFGKAAATATSGTLRPSSPIIEQWLGTWSPAAPADVIFDLDVDDTTMDVRWSGTVTQKVAKGNKRIEFQGSALPLPTRKK